MNIKDFTKGWLIGDFEPSLYKTKDVEVGIKIYKAGDKEKAHFHKIATEYTIIISGIVRMLNKLHAQGDIVVIPPNISNEFECIKDAILLVIKTPSVVGDKYEI